MLLQVAEKCATLHLLLTLDNRIWLVVFLNWLLYHVVILRYDILWENRLLLLISKFSTFWFILFLLTVFVFFNILIFLTGAFEYFCLL